MRLRLFLTFAGILLVLGIEARATTYSVAIGSGYTPIASQLHQGGDTLNEVVTNAPDQSLLYKWNVASQSYDGAQKYIAGSGWVDVATSQPSTTTLAPGEGAFIYNPAGPANLVFSGNSDPATQPPSLNCGQLYLLGRPSYGIGTFENLTGLSPQDGSQVYIYNSGNAISPVQPPAFSVYTYCGSGWIPVLPDIDVGAAVFVRQSCQLSCVSIQAPANIVVTSSNFITVDFASQISATSICGGTNGPATFVCRPPSGSVFAPGATSVHCVAVDVFGNAASADFTVTVVPPPVADPVDSNTLTLHTGINLIANQFNHGGNTLLEIMPHVPNGSIVFKFNNATLTWAESVYNATLGAWVPANITLSPGEGAFFYNPNNNNLSLTLSGTPNTPVLPLNFTVNSPTLLLSRQTNEVGTYENIIGASPINGAVIYKLEVSDYAVYKYFSTPGVWEDSDSNVVPEPTANPGEAVWISPNGIAPPDAPSTPFISTQPVSQHVNSGSTSTLSVGATGSTPLNYQWRLNGQAIPGATNSTFTNFKTTPANCGTYNVSVFNSIGLVTSSNVTISLNGLTVLPFTNTFASAISLGSGTNITVTGNNMGATTEPKEPSPGFIPGGASVWLHWTVPGKSGIATIKLQGSTFDTLLGVYTGTNVNKLTPVAWDDDSGGNLTSLVKFNAVQGTTYYIQVDGFYGSTGNILLNLNMQETAFTLPVITNQPQSLTVAPGASASFSVSVALGVGLQFRWYRNGVFVNGGTDNILPIASVTAATVGSYQVIVSNAQTQLAVSSFPAELQINYAGSGNPINPTTRAEDKYLAASDTTIRPNDPYDPSIVTGYTGTQIFGTYGSGTDPDEPAHCGTACVFTKWHSYMALTNGILSVLNTGTTFSGVLAVYTGSPTNYPSLVPIACSAGHAAGGEVVSFEAVAGTAYWIMMGATNSTGGTVQLQYKLSTPPFFNLLPASQSLIQGTNGLLTASATGNPPATYQWQLNGTNIEGATGTALPLTAFQARNEGHYSVIAANAFGTNIFSYASVYLDSGLRFINQQAVGDSFFAQLVGSPNSNYLIQATSDLLHTNWRTMQSGGSSTGIQNFTDTLNFGTNRIYRASAPAPLK